MGTLIQKPRVFIGFFYMDPNSSGLEGQGFIFRFLPIGSLTVPFGGLVYRILNMDHKKELLRSLWVD